MKTLTTGSESATIELTKDEIALIIYCYQTSNEIYTNKGAKFFEKFGALIKQMEYLKKVGTAISEVFNEK